DVSQAPHLTDDLARAQGSGRGEDLHTLPTDLHHGIDQVSLLFPEQRVALAGGTAQSDPAHAGLDDQLRHPRGLVQVNRITRLPAPRSLLARGWRQPIYASDILRRSHGAPSCTRSIQQPLTLAASMHRSPAPGKADCVRSEASLIGGDAR